MTYQITTRDGSKFTGKAYPYESDHAIKLLVTKGRKVFVGKFILLAKADIIKIAKA